MKIKYLGTAAAEGCPGLFCRCAACAAFKEKGGKNIRTRSQSIIDDKLLVDFPPDTYGHMIQHGVDVPNLKHCLITHVHTDHYYPSDLAMRGSWFANNIDDVPFTVYGNDELMRRMEILADDKENLNQTRGYVEWKELQAFEPTEIEGYTVTALLAKHDPAEKCFVYLVEKDGEGLFYGNDTAMLPEATWEYLGEKMPKMSIVSLDCTMGVQKGGRTHMGMQECIETKKRMLEMGVADEKTVFVVNHFSHNGFEDESGKVWLHDEFAALMKTHGFETSYDGCVISTK